VESSPPFSAGFEHVLLNPLPFDLGICLGNVAQGQVEELGGWQAGE